MPDHVPIEAVRAFSLWGLIVLAAVALWRPIVRRTGWERWPTLMVLAWTGLVLAVTVPMTVEPGAGGRLEECLAHPASDIAWSLRIFGSRGLEDVMNVALWVPCGFLGVLATRRAIAAPVVIAAGFVVVELLQTLDPGRECDCGDMAYNSIGVTAGALAAAALLRFRTLAADRSSR